MEKLYPRLSQSESRIFLNSKIIIHKNFIQHSKINHQNSKYEKNYRNRLRRRLLGTRRVAALRTRTIFLHRPRPIQRIRRRCERTRLEREPARRKHGENRQKRLFLQVRRENRLVRLRLHHHPRHSGRKRHHAGLFRPAPPALLHQLGARGGNDVRQIRAEQLPARLRRECGRQHSGAPRRGAQALRGRGGRTAGNALFREARGRRLKFRRVESEKGRPAGACAQKRLHAMRPGND